MNKNTEVFVQSNFIKDGFTEHFDISKDRIHVISPKLAVPILNETKYSNQNQDKINWHKKRNSKGLKRRFQSNIS